jgi:hypothetical protein
MWRPFKRSFSVSRQCAAAVLPGKSSRVMFAQTREDPVIDMRVARTVNNSKDVATYVVLAVV